MNFNQQCIGQSSLGDDSDQLSTVDDLS